jgi:crotonobetainyl-CoA:carnitine CoA-transferase CaiB-like acyl-CoA transferase
MLAIMGPDVSNYVATGVDPIPGQKIASPRGSYLCKDGLWVSMSGSTDTMAKRVFEAIGQSALFEDPHFSSNAARLENDEELDAMVAEFMLQRTQDECLKHFRQHGVTVGPIYASPQLIQDAHVVQRGVYVQCVAGDGAEPTVMHQVTPRLQSTPGSIRRTAPQRGQHTEELLAELGASAHECQTLKNLGAIEWR